MPYESITRADLRLRLQEKVEAVPFWTDEEANLAINESLRVWNSLTGYWKERVVVHTIPNDPFLALPGSVVYNTRIAFNEKPLALSSLTDMDYGRRWWQGERTTDGGTVPIEPRVWIPISVQLIAIWPVDADGYNSLTVDGVTRTPVLTDDDDYVDIGLEELSTLLGYCLHILTLKEGGPRFQSTIGVYRAFIQAAAMRNDVFRASSFYRHFMGLDTKRLAEPIRAAPAIEGT